MSVKIKQGSETEQTWNEVELFIKSDSPTHLNFQRFPGKDKIPLAELKSLLGDVGLDLPNFKIREILNKLRQDTRDEFVTKAQFLKVRVL